MRIRETEIHCSRIVGPDSREEVGRVRQVLRSVQHTLRRLVVLNVDGFLAIAEAVALASQFKGENNDRRTAHLGWSQRSPIRTA